MSVVQSVTDVPVHSLSQEGLVTASCALGAHIHGALRGVPARSGSRKTRPIDSAGVGWS